MGNIEKLEKDLLELQNEVNRLKSNIDLANHSVSGTLIDLEFVKKEIYDLRKKIESKSLNIAEVQSFYIEKILEIKKDLSKIEKRLFGDGQSE